MKYVALADACTRVPLCFFLVRAAILGKTGVSRGKLRLSVVSEVRGRSAQSGDETLGSLPRAGVPTPQISPKFGEIERSGGVVSL